MKISRAEIPDILILQPDELGGSVGRMIEGFRLNELTEAARGEFGFVESSINYDVAWVIHGLSFQNPRPQGRLVTLINGRIQHILVDLRNKSATYGKYVSYIMSEGNPRSIWVPPGFASGYLTIGSPATVLQLFTEYHEKSWAKAIKWNDPDIGVKWAIVSGHNPTMTSHDRAGIDFSKVKPIELK